MATDPNIGRTWEAQHGTREVTGTDALGRYKVRTPMIGGRDVEYLVSPEDLEQEIRLDVRGVQAARERVEHKKAKEAEAAAERAEYENDRGFTADMPQIKRARILKVLDAGRSISGKSVRLRDWVPAMVDKGWHPNKDGTRFESPDESSFYEARDITKTAIDYARFLVEQGHGPAVAAPPKTGDDELAEYLDAMVAPLDDVVWEPQADGAKIVFGFKSTRKPIAVLTKEGTRWIIRYKGAAGDTMRLALANLPEVAEWLRDEVKTRTPAKRTEERKPVTTDPRANVVLRNVQSAVLENLPPEVSRKYAAGFFRRNRETLEAQVAKALAATEPEPLAKPKAEVAKPKTKAAPVGVAKATGYIHVFEGMPASELFDQARAARGGTARARKNEVYVDANVQVDGDPTPSVLFISRGKSGFLKGKYWIDQDVRGRGRADVSVDKASQTIRISAARAEAREARKETKRAQDVERARLDALIPPRSDARVLPYFQAIDSRATEDNLPAVDMAHDRGARYFVAGEPEAGEAFARRVLGDKTADAFLAVWHAQEDSSATGDRKAPEQPRRYVSRTGVGDDSFTVIDRSEMEISAGSIQRALRQYRKGETLGTAGYDEIPLWDGPAGEFITVQAFLDRTSADEKAKQTTQRVEDAKRPVLKAKPEDSTIHEPGYFSSWGGKLASVYGPYDADDFDVDKMVYKWTVHFVDGGRGEPLATSDRRILLGRAYTGTGGNDFRTTHPDSMQAMFGKFLPAQVFWIKAALKDIHGDAAHRVAQMLHGQGYVDTAEYTNPKADKLTKADWRKVLALAPTTKPSDHDLEAVYDLFGDNYDKGNAVYELVSLLAEQAQHGLWAGTPLNAHTSPGAVLHNLGGVLQTSRTGKILWTISAEDVAKKTKGARQRAKTEPDPFAGLQDLRDALGLLNFYEGRRWNELEYPWAKDGSFAPGGSYSPEAKRQRAAFQRWVEEGYVRQSGERFVETRMESVPLYDLTPAGIALVDAHVGTPLRQDIDRLKKLEYADSNDRDARFLSDSVFRRVYELRAPIEAANQEVEARKLYDVLRKNKPKREALLWLYYRDFPAGGTDGTPASRLPDDRMGGDKLWNWLEKRDLVRYAVPYSGFHSYPEATLTDLGVLVASKLHDNPVRGQKAWAPPDEEN